MPPPLPDVVEPATPVAVGARAAVPYVAAGLMALILVPTLVPLIPQVAFDLDPRSGLSQAGAATGLTAGRLAWWAAGTGLLSAMALAVALAAGVRLRLGMLLLAGAAGGAVLWHLGSTVEDGLHGAVWLAALSAVAAWLHLGRLAAARQWAAAVLLAVTPLWALDAAQEVWVEYPINQAFFAQHKAELFAAKGLDAGSEAAELYERRQSFNDATGPMGFSNVFASLAGAAGVLAAAAGVVWLRRRRAIAAAAAGLVALSAAMVVVLSHSKGAPGALVATAAAGLAVAAALRWGGRAAPRWACAAGPLAVLAVLGAVALRLAVGEPAPPAGGFVPGAPVQGERSLLFRGHYAVAAARIVAAHPVTGSGVRGFADRYPQVKAPHNPESVTSAHGLVADAAAMLGLGGWAVVGLLFWALACAGAGLVRHDPGSGPPGPPGPPGPGPEPDDAAGLRPGVLAGVILFGIVLPAQVALLSPMAAWGWLLGIAVFAALLAAITRPGAPAVPAAAWWGTGVFVALHGQLEMTFYQPSTAALMASLVALAAAAAPGRGSGRQAGRAHRWAGVGPAVAVATVLGLTGVLAWHAAGMSRHDTLLQGAAAALRRGEPALAVDRLAAAQHAAGLDRTALSWRVRLHVLEGPMRPSDDRVTQALGWLDQAQGQAAITGGWFARQRAALIGARATHPGASPQAITAARDAWAAAAALQRHHVGVALSHADAAAKAQDPAPAVAELYLRVLTLRENGYLDAADPLTAAQLKRVRAGASVAVPR